VYKISSMMIYPRNNWQADFAMFDRNGQLVAVAEAKNLPDIDLEWAMEWFGYRLELKEAVMPRFVLLVTPGKLYVWKQTAAPPSVEPAAAIDARRLFDFYLERSTLRIDRLNGATFEFLVGAWLDAFAHGMWQPSTPEERRALIDTGLLEAVENGRVVSEVAA
jgi:hypothetical protein